MATFTGMHFLEDTIAGVDVSVDMPFNDVALKEATGKDWQEWKVSLDTWGAAEKSQRNILAYLTDEIGVNTWWAQGIVVGYERQIGRRAVGQRNDGTYSASASKTINTSIERIHATLVNETLRNQWIDGSAVRLLTSISPKTARFDDLDANVIITFELTTESENKTALQLEGNKFLSSEDADAWKKIWQDRLAALAEYLTQ